MPSHSDDPRRHAASRKSGASRLVGAATDADYLQSAPCLIDGRTREVSLTKAGRGVRALARKWQDEVFAQLTDSWTEAELHAFCPAMDDLINRSKQMDKQGK